MTQEFTVIIEQDEDRIVSGGGSARCWRALGLPIG